MFTSWVFFNVYWVNLNPMFEIISWFGKTHFIGNKVIPGIPQYHLCTIWFNNIKRLLGGFPKGTMLNKKRVWYLYCITSSVCFAFEIMQGVYQLKYMTARFPGLWHGNITCFYGPIPPVLIKKNYAFMVVFYRCGMMFLMMPKRGSNKYTVYVCHRWQQLCSVCTSYNIALFHSSVIYHQTGSKSEMKGITSSVEPANPSAELDFTRVFRGACVV